MDLLRLSTAGSVDDGKSTLIGRLLFDTKGAYEDQLAAIRKNGHVDLSLLTDGLRAEREQKITIDVAYRYFATPKRKFIIADTPGHEQYTRNMATGASTAALTVILIDARKGVLPQSRRHAYIASLLGIPRVAVAVNKMDLVGFSEEVFCQVQQEFRIFARGLGFEEIRFFPICAVEGDNVVTVSHRTPWFHGSSLLDYLETVPTLGRTSGQPLRLPVQHVIRPTLDFRGYAGQIAAGTIRPGDSVLILPSGRTSTVQKLVSFDGDLDQAYAPMSVNVTLADEIDISRGDMLVSPEEPPQVSRRVEASLVWMDDQPLRLGRPYFVKHTSSTVRGTIIALQHKIDINTLEHHPAGTLQLNEIGVVTLETHIPLLFDEYSVNRITGAFILIDPVSNATTAAGMIRGAIREGAEHARVTASERHARNGHDPAIVLVPHHGEQAYELERALFDRGLQVAITDELYQAQALRAAGLIALLRDAGTEWIDVGQVCRDLESSGTIPGL